MNEEIALFRIEYLCGLIHTTVLSFATRSHTSDTKRKKSPQESRKKWRFSWSNIKILSPEILQGLVHLEGLGHKK